MGYRIRMVQEILNGSVSLAVAVPLLGNLKLKSRSPRQVCDVGLEPRLTSPASISREVLSFETTRLAITLG
jgi:hypothetical protein